MPRILGAFRGHLLGILVLAGLADGFIRPKPDLEICACGLDHWWCPPDISRPCETGIYCKNQGHEFSSKQDEQPACKECKSGYYFSTDILQDKKVLQTHQSVRGRDVVTVTRDCADIGLDVIQCQETRTETGAPSDKFFQVCQHCPMHTIVNSNSRVNGGARCFSSCYEAHTVMMLKETLSDADRKFTAPRLINAGGTLDVRDSSTDPFPGSGGEGFALQILHSVVKFAQANGVSDWMTTEKQKYDDYINYKNTHREDFQRILLMPPPERKCRPCEAGKSMFTVSCSGNGARECATKKEMPKLKETFSAGLQPHRVNDISWLEDAAFTEFFQLDVCEDCPVGTYFNPQDLESNVKDYRLVEKVWSLTQLRCRPCRYGTYTDTPGGGSCGQCPPNQYVVETSYSMKIRREDDLRNILTPRPQVGLLASCASCPAGTEYRGDAAAVLFKARCSAPAIEMLTFASLFQDDDRSLQLPRDISCCRPCLLNHHRGGPDDEPCQRGGFPSYAPYGQAAPRVCKKGQVKRYCMARNWDTWDERESPCTISGSNTNTDWIACVSCLETEKPVELYSEPGCQLCNKNNEGEFFKDGECQTCEECDVLKVDFHMHRFEWETDVTYTTSLATWAATHSTDFQWEGRWKYQKVSASCVPLQRRKMSWNASTKAVTISGGDHYKEQASASERGDGRRFVEKKLEDFYAVHYDRIEDTKRRCRRQHCKDVCSGNRYQYSHACGESADPWVTLNNNTVVDPLRKSELELKLKGDRNAVNELQLYVILHHGKCQWCTLCGRGQYNDQCNKWGGPVGPEGVCVDCKSECLGAGEFLWHEGGLRGCDPVNGRADKVKVLTNYECRKCPTWIRRNGVMSAVLGCGNKETFRYFKIESFVYTTADFTMPQVDVLIRQAGLVVDQAVLTKFKPFYYAAPYCPRNYYFDATRSGCLFTSLEYILVAGETIEHGVNAYNLACCVKCEDCDPNTERRVKNKWQECDGSSVIDTEKEHCVRKCQSGYYSSGETEAGTPGECIQCTRCPPL